MTKKIKPDGFCAWHPEDGWLTASVAKKEHDAWIALTNLAVGVVSPATIFEERKRKLLLDGWQIRPVCLIDPGEYQILLDIEEDVR